LLVLLGSPVAPSCDGPFPFDFHHVLLACASWKSSCSKL